MSPEDSFRWARDAVRTAERSLEKRQDLLRVKIEINSAFYWSVDGWLATRGEPQGPSFMDSAQTFSRVAPPALKQEVWRLSQESSWLEYRLIGDPEGVVKRVGLEEWLLLAKKGVAGARAAVDLLESDAGLRAPPAG